ncbi:MAG: 30S ribosomal protein S1 [Desulfovibrio sp.]|nr:30S ribosomal protein S1 [Desulfovibrio sp.]
MSDEQQMQQEDTESFAALFEQQTQAAMRLQAGQKVSGTIIDISGDSVFVDVGIKVDGVMDRKDIVNAEGEEIYKAGDTIEAWVVRVSSHEVRLSRSMSGSGVAALEEAQESGIPVDGKVLGVCKGGYTVEVLGKRAFCPGSQMEALSEGDDVTGRTMQFLISRVESRGRNIIVSRRALINKERSENLEKMLETLHVGDTTEATVSRLAPFGAFVTLAPSVEGLVHVSELSWSRVAAPEEVCAVGDRISVKVLAIEKTDKGTRISLSRKRAEGDPWEKVGDSLSQGQIVTGKVLRLMPFGAFVELLPGVEGMVHVSEMAWGRRVHKPEDVVAVGDEVKVKILEINPEGRRIALSIRDAEGDPWNDVEETLAPGTTVEGQVENKSPFGFFVTLKPGVTGLLPLSSLKGLKDQSQFQQLKSGDSVKVVVQRVDLGARKISLMPEGAKDAVVKETEGASDWKQHSKTVQPKSSLGILGQALQKAMEKK